MKYYRAWYKLYNAGTSGYHTKMIEAESDEDAEKKLWEFLNGRMILGEIEYTLTEAVFGFRLYDSKERVRK